MSSVWLFGAEKLEMMIIILLLSAKKILLTNYDQKLRTQKSGELWLTRRIPTVVFPNLYFRIRSSGVYMHILLTIIKQHFSTGSQIKTESELSHDHKV